MLPKIIVQIKLQINYEKDKLIKRDNKKNVKDCLNEK